MADIGDEIKDYIAKIASSSVTNDDVVANMREADKKKDAEMANMSAQIKQLTAAGPNLPLGRTTTLTRTVVAAATESLSR